MRQPSIAVVGLGSIGSRHARNLLSMGYKNIVGFDPRCTLIEPIVPIVDDIKHAAHFEFTHAVICSPPSLHYRHALRFISRGVPVFIEKPITESALEAESLCRQARDFGASITVGYMERYNATVLAAKRFAIENPVKNAYIECYWHMAEKSYEQDFLLESSHVIDTAQFILGDLKPGTYQGEGLICDYLVHHQGGNCYLNINADNLPMRRINLYAHNGKTFGSQYGTSPEEWDACYRAELQGFLDGNPLCTGEDALKVMELIDEVRK